MQPLRIAVIGAGRLGGFHAQKIARSPYFHLVGVVDPSLSARERLAQECAVQAYASHEELNGTIDAAIVATPSVHHFRIAHSLLAAGVHLLVEKPLTTTAAEANDLVATARSSGVVLQVGHVERFNPALAAVASELTQPQYIEAVRSSPFTFRSIDIGAVFDLMVHDIDIVLSLARSALRRVDATGISIFGDHEDVANARLEFHSGCVASLSVSRAATEQARRMSVWSAQAIATVDYATRSATIVRPCESIVSGKFHAERLAANEIEYYRQHLTDELMPQERMQFEAVDALALEIDDFAQSILTGGAPRVTGDAGRDAVVVAEQILAAIDDHKRQAAQRPESIPLPWVASAGDRKAG